MNGSMRTLAAILGIAYLLNPVVGWANLSEMFHPDAFEIPLVLFEDKAPITVKNFLRYVDEGHYNGKIFHRVGPSLSLSE